MGSYPQITGQRPYHLVEPTDIFARSIRESVIVGYCITFPFPFFNVYLCPFCQGERQVFSQKIAFYPNFTLAINGKLWFNVKHDKTDIPFFSCGNYKGNRGTCKSTHYIRADALEQIVMMELRWLAEFLYDDEDTFAEMLAAKSNEDAIREQKHLEAVIQKSQSRMKKVEVFFEKL